MSAQASSGASRSRKAAPVSPLPWRQRRRSFGTAVEARESDAKQPQLRSSGVALAVESEQPELRISDVALALAAGQPRLGSSGAVLAVEETQSLPWIATLAVEAEHPWHWSSACFGTARDGPLAMAARARLRQIRRKSRDDIPLGLLHLSFHCL
eukprot:TRINITY_DN51967_c0_g1_i1.p2 TRINITY_DN51967_c0_g1~~TRINITY_DN51967_c0_g1_i1.p2  ORF type:complete len:154 (-),score=27.69 TRINITY_DN51967_c0_g1_i1:26-487(-)